MGTSDLSEPKICPSAMTMIDLHTHILPGLDDGPANVDFSLALARAMEGAGIEVAAATPHIRPDHAVDPLGLQEQVDAFNARLREAGYPLRVVRGGEVDLSRALTLDDAQIEAVCLGRGQFLLVESPRSGIGDSLERGIEKLHERGVRPILAHPERSGAFLSEPERLERLVDAGALCSITAASMTGGFGRRARRFAAHLFKRGLVHDVASDAHDHIFRAPDLVGGFEAMDELVPGLSAQADWYTRTAPAAILEGREPGPPPSVPRPPSRLRKLATPLLG